MSADHLTNPRSRAILDLLDDYGIAAYIDPDPKANRVIIVTGSHLGQDGKKYTTFGCIPRDYIQAKLYVEGKIEATPIILTSE